MNQRGPNRPVGSHVVVFLLSMLLSAGLYVALHRYVERDSLLFRYVAGHWVEYVETAMFVWALLALVAKHLGLHRQRAAFRYELLPAWSGVAAPVGEAAALLHKLGKLPAWVRGSLLGKRVSGGLEFVQNRGSTEGLDEHLGASSDSDANEVDGSYSLIRFITWAIPILGFLGTVLGITEAIANVTPEQLATSITGVTDGLAIAFDTTAIALGYSMCIMFLTFILDRGEQALLGRVDDYAEQHVAHRFERLANEGTGLLNVLEKNNAALLATTDKLVERQAAIWSQTIDSLQQEWLRTQQRQQEAFRQALEQVFDHTVTKHEQRLQTLEERFTDQLGDLLEHFARMSLGLQNAVQAAERQGHLVTEQVAALQPLVETERHVLRLQETMQGNLQTLTQAGAFEEALHSLTAAIHLLTARASDTRPATLRRPGTAA